MSRRGHQACDKNSQLTRADEFCTKPAFDEISDAGLLVEKMKLVLDSMKALQKLGAVWDLNLTGGKRHNSVPRRLARLLAMRAQPRI